MTVIKVNKAKSAYINNHNSHNNNSDNEKLVLCAFVKRVSMTGLVSVGVVSPFIIVVEVASWTGGSNIRSSVKP